MERDAYLHIHFAQIHNVLVDNEFNLESATSFFYLSVLKYISQWYIHFTKVF